MMPITPILEQSVRFGEHYVSRALNEKFSGIFPQGVYRGFVLKPSVLPMQITVANDKDWSNSVAIVERDGYSMTIMMRDAGDISIPAVGVWFVCIEAYYSIKQAGYQRIVVKSEADLQSYHIILGQISVSTMGETLLPIDMSMISDVRRMECNPVGSLNPLDRKEIELIHLNYANFATEVLRLSNRVTTIELAHVDGDGSGGGGNISPGGYETAEGAKIVPLTIIKEGEKTVDGAAMTMVVASYSATSVE